MTVFSPYRGRTAWNNLANFLQEKCKIKSCHHFKTSTFETASKRMITNLLILFFFVASTSQYQNKKSDEDAKASDHLKKVPICGYVHYTSPVKPSRSNYTSFNFKFQTANGFCDGVCFDKGLYDQVTK